METELSDLKRILVNFKKSINRGYSKDTILSKLQEIEVIKDKFKALVENSTEKDSVLIELKTNFNLIFSEIKTLLTEALSKINNMSDFNLELSLKTIPEFNGNVKEVNKFIAIGEIIHNSIKPEQRHILLNVIYNIKLTDKVRIAIGAQPASFEILKKELLSRFRSYKTVAQIQLMLNSLTQKNMKISAYNDKILELIAELNDLQAKEIPNCSELQNDTINLINKGLALNVFKNGLCAELKPTIFASKPKDLSEAVQLAMQLESDMNINSDQVMYFTGDRNRHFNRNNNRNFSNNNNRGNSTGNNGYNNNGNRNNNNNNNGNRYNNRNNNNNNGNGYNNNNGNSRNRNRNNGNNQNRNWNNNNGNNANNNRSRNNRNIHFVQENSQDPVVNEENVQFHHPEQQQQNQ